jgi:hypothetical protein
MGDKRLEEAVRQCQELMQTLPEEKRKQLESLLEETRHRHHKNKLALQQSMDALADWRLLQKYCVFDREARLREAKHVP